MTAARPGGGSGVMPAPRWADRCSCRDRVERERRRQVAVGVDLLLAFGELLLSLRERVGAGDEPERRLLFAGDGQECVGELGGVADLPAVHAIPELAVSRVALGVVLDRRWGVVRRVLREQFGAEEPGVDDRGVDAEWLDLGGE